MPPITTTLKAIRKCSPCGLRPESNGTLTGYVKLKAFLGECWDDDAPVKFSEIVASNGLDDALWCLRSICPHHEKEVRLFAADCAESVLHIFEKLRPNDNRPRLAIKAARDFANGEIDAAAWAAAWDAARDAALLAGLHIVSDLDVNHKHWTHARARWDVWQRGYGLACDINGVLFTYGKQP